MDNPPENSVAPLDNSEELPEKQEQLPDKSQELATNEEKVEKRTRGRPKGSKDTVPRRPRVVMSPEPDPPPPKPKERKPREQTREPVYQEPPQPPSPRTVFRQASDSLAALQDQREQARRADWQDAIARSLR
jgi:hypothetical protein